VGQFPGIRTYRELHGIGYTPVLKMVKLPRKQERVTPPEPSPMADVSVQLAYRRTQTLFSIFQTLFQATKGVFRPGPDDPKTWYGRLLRGMGLLCVWAVIAGCVAIAIQEFISSVRGR
jgi:hypothetical protein